MFPQTGIGDALLQKTVTTDFLNKKRVANKGIVPQYYVENSHEAIILRALFLQVQEEMVRRARVKTGTGKRRVYSGKYALSHLVYCSDCGDLYRRTQWFLKGEHVPVWRCVSRLEKKEVRHRLPIPHALRDGFAGGGRDGLQSDDRAEG